MECWNIILLTILVLIILNFLFWCYCIFFRRKNRCGNLHFTVKYVNKKHEEGAIFEDDNDDDDDDDDDDNISENQNGHVYEMCRLSDVNKSSWKYKRALPEIPELIEENNESDKLLVNGNNDEQKLNMAAGGAPEQGNTGDSETTTVQITNAARQLHPPPPPPPSPHTLPPPSPPPLPPPTWMWETPAEFKNDPVYQVLDDNDWDKYVQKGGD